MKKQLSLFPHVEENSSSNLHSVHNHLRKLLTRNFHDSTIFIDEYDYGQRINSPFQKLITEKDVIAKIELIFGSKLEDVFDIIFRVGDAPQNILYSRGYKARYILGMFNKSTEIQEMSDEALGKIPNFHEFLLYSKKILPPNRLQELFCICGDRVNEISLLLERQRQFEGKIGHSASSGELGLRKFTSSNSRENIKYINLNNTSPPKPFTSSPTPTTSSSKPLPPLPPRINPPSAMNKQNNPPSSSSTDNDKKIEYTPRPVPSQPVPNLPLNSSQPINPSFMQTLSQSLSRNLLVQKNLSSTQSPPNPNPHSNSNPLPNPPTSLPSPHSSLLSPHHTNLPPPLAPNNGDSLNTSISPRNFSQITLPPPPPPLCKVSSPENTITTKTIITPLSITKSSSADNNSSINPLPSPHNPPLTPTYIYLNNPLSPRPFQTTTHTQTAPAPQRPNPTSIELTARAAASASLVVKKRKRKRKKFQSPRGRWWI